jgi:hypothetical protein
MSEMPEKKVLKMALTKMKANAITAIDKYNTRVKSINELLSIIFKGFGDTSSLPPRDKEIAKSLRTVFTSLLQEVTELETESLETINDWRAYTEVLENYSAELDGTLTKIFEDAIKQSTEQIEKQKELVVKKPEYTV